MRRHFSLATVLAVMVITAGSAPAWAQAGSDARLGGGSDIPPEVTVRLPQGGSLPPVHVIYADNPTDEAIEVEFRAEAPMGILVEPEWDEKTVPAQGSVANPFSVRVGPGVAPGEYPVVLQLVRSDIESEPGRITSIPAIQTVFTVEVTGEAATVTVRSVSVHSGEPVAATITLSARDGERGWFEVDRTEGHTLESRVAPGEYRAAVLLGEREMATEEFTVEADQTHDVVIEVETVSFVVAAVRPVEEMGRLVVAELVASVNNETEPIPGPNLLQATVSHGGVEIDTITLDELSEVSAGITEATVTYRPDDGWQEGIYRFVFELVTPAFTLAASDQAVLEVPAMGFDPLAFLVALDIREAIALAAAALLGLVLVERLIRYLIKRRRRSENGPTRKQRRLERAESRRAGRFRRMSRIRRASEPEPNWLEERIGPATAQRSRWDDANPDDAPTTPPSTPAQESGVPAPLVAPHGAHLVPNEQATPHPDPTPPIPPGSSATASASGSGDTAQMVEALRVVQRLHDRGSLAPGWSITDATLVYWAMISPRVHEDLGSLGMTEEEYLAAMRRLFAHGLLGRGRLPGDSTDG